jgi:hypothetical protein
MGWAWHVERMGEKRKASCRILVGKSEGNIGVGGRVILK